MQFVSRSPFILKCLHEAYFTSIAVHRKHEQSALKLKGPALSRRASYGPGGGRPFLHQYEVKGLCIGTCLSCKSSEY